MKCISPLFTGPLRTHHSILHTARFLPRSSSIFSHGGSFSWIPHFRRRQDCQRQGGLRPRGTGQSAVELRRRPGGHEVGAGVHLCSAPGRREAVGQGEVGAAVAQAAEERRLRYLGHDGRLPRH